MSARLLVTGQLTAATLARVRDIVGNDLENVWVVSSPFNVKPTAGEPAEVTDLRTELLSRCHKMNLRTFGSLVKALNERVLKEHMEPVVADSYYIPIEYGPTKFPLERSARVHLLDKYLDSVRTPENHDVVKLMQFRISSLWARYFDRVTGITPNVNEQDFDRVNDFMFEKMDWKAHLDYRLLPRLLGADDAMLETMSKAEPIKYTDARGNEREASLQHDILRLWAKIIAPFGPTSPVADIAAVFFWQCGLEPMDDDKQAGEAVMAADLSAPPAVNWSHWLGDGEFDDMIAGAMIYERQQDQPLKMVYLQLPAGDHPDTRVLRHDIITFVHKAAKRFGADFTYYVDPDSRNAEALKTQWAGHMRFNDKVGRPDTYLNQAEIQSMTTDVPKRPFSQYSRFERETLELGIVEVNKHLFTSDKWRTMTEEQKQPYRDKYLADVEECRRTLAEMGHE